jgi:hypothetical protein
VTLLNDEATRRGPKEYAAASFDAEDWPAMEAPMRGLLFEKPQEFWNLPKLQEVYKFRPLAELAGNPRACVRASSRDPEAQPACR